MHELAIAESLVAAVVDKTGEQRVTWFKNGFTSGQPTDCDTFKGEV